MPYSKGWILLSCSLLPALVFLVLTLLVGFIYAASATEIVLFWSFVMLLAIIQGAAEAFGIKGRDLILYATNIALALGVYFMIQ